MEQLIRELILNIDGESLPRQKKNISGKTKGLYVKNTLDQAGKLVEIVLEYLNLFARAVREIGLRLEILTDKKFERTFKYELSK